MQILENLKVPGAFEDAMQKMHQITAARSTGLRVNRTVSSTVDIRCKASGETTDTAGLADPLPDGSSSAIAKYLSVPG